MAVDRRLKLLLLSDLDGQTTRVTALCERVVCSRDHDVDAVLVCDGFVSASEPVAYDVPEKKAAAEGDMMSLISRLETIVCRIIYSPGENDPPTTRPLLPVAPNLTQYSANCFFKTEMLVPGVGIVGEIGYHCAFGEGRDPTEHLDLLLVLRNQHASTALPAPQVL
ncbi:hypothetical protein PINS_up002445 [Pythium insidiosum]|nr:hypothetical protein PINS_up002445 [Pythium insidiosum]